MHRLLVLLVIAGCGRDAPSPSAARVSDEDYQRAHTLVTELKRSLLGAVTQAMAGGVPAAIEACHVQAPALTAAAAREGAVLGRATRKPRNPANAAAGWQAEALTHFERLVAAGKPLADQSFGTMLPGKRFGYAQPLVIQDVCLACHGAALAPDVQAALAARYPDDRATGYVAGDLRGVAWVELPLR